MGTSGTYNHLFYLLINARNVMDLLKKSCGLTIREGVIGMPEPSPQLLASSRTTR